MSTKSKDPHHDVSKLEREMIEWKHQRRLELRDLYLREAYNPVRSYLPVDDGVYRAAVMRITMGKFFSPTPNLMGVMSLIIGMTYIAGFLLYTDKEKEKKEKAAGMVSYDRKFKFQ